MTSNIYSKENLRRWIMGLQGLWPGRRWSGAAGTAEAMRQIQAVQLDPLNITARSQHILLWSRVADYRPNYLDQAAYEQRGFFDYGDWLFMYPMAELPCWRVSMQRRLEEGRWGRFYAENGEVLERVRTQLRERGPLGNRDFTDFNRVSSYRGRKDTANALYALWMVGEVMIHHRDGFERIYDFRENVAPRQYDYAAAPEEAELFFAQKSLALWGAARERAWASTFSSAIHRKVSPQEGQAWMRRLMDLGLAETIRVEGAKEPWYALSSTLPALNTLAAGTIPEEWKPAGATTLDEVSFLAPLDWVSARGRAAWLFDFEYVWEVYKPVEQRRWGYYTLPVLYGDRLVARIDPKLDRTSATLQIKGFWLDDAALAADPAFAAALANGLRHFARLLDAQTIDLKGLIPEPLWALVRAGLGKTLEQVA